MPLVSIVLPTYNGARYIRECIDSCLNQTFRDLELIVVVDGSTDDTEEILRSYRDPRLRIIVTPNRGQAPAMNTGFEVAQGAYWSWTSDDNVYMLDAFQVMVNYMEDHPEAAAVSTDCLLINETGTAVGYQECAWQCFLYRSDAGLRAGPHRCEARIIEDVDFFVRLRHYGGPVHRIARPYLKYRIHKGTVSHRMAAQRPLVSVKLNYDLIAQGVVNYDLRELFMDRLSKAALYRNYSAMEKIVEFAIEKDVPFVEDLVRQKQYLNTWPGWWTNRIRIAYRSQKGRLRSFAKFVWYLLVSAGRKA